MPMGMFISPELAAFGLTPRDSCLQEGTDNPIESREPDVEPEDVVKVLQRVPDWHPAAEAMIRRAPKGPVIHWPLLWRDLRPEWTSQGGHVVQLGDAAHSSVNTFTAGATLALEDAIILAACLQLSSSGRGSALGARIYNLLRYQRVSCAQEMAFVNSQVLNAATIDWDATKQDPKGTRIPFPKRIFQHDTEAYVYEKYGKAFAHLVAGTEFKNTNYRPVQKFVPWTIEEVHKDVAQGKRLEELLDGDWL